MGGVGPDIKPLVLCLWRNVRYFGGWEGGGRTPYDELPGFAATSGRFGNR